MSEIVPAPHVTLHSGQRVFALIGVSTTALSLIPSKGLRPSHFSASPNDVVAWSTLSKAALQRALIELQWEQVTAERDRRRKAKSAEAIEKTISSTQAAVTVLAAPLVSLALSRKRPRRIESIDSPLLIVDCDYDNLMTKGEGASLGSQLIHCYAAVRRRRAFVRLLLAGVCDARLTQLARVSGAGTWKIHVTRDPLERLLTAKATDDDASVPTITSPPLPHPSLSSLPSTGIGADACPLLYTTHTTYLTADAPTIIWRFEPGEAYVIGGVVDKNRHPGIAAARAATLGFRTARFPLIECGALETSVVAAAGAHRRRVLTTNKAVELCAAVIEGYLGEGEGEGVIDEKMVWRKAITLVLGGESVEGGGEGGAATV